MDKAGLEAFAAIRRAHERGRPAQAYLVTGAPRGEAGELARHILAFLFCRAESGRPCGACPACRGAQTGTLADAMTLEPTLKSQAIAIEQVRDLIRFMGQTAFEGGWKAGVIVHADRMTLQAANAFLKLLEEPRGRTVFLLLTAHPDGLPATIVSRCQRIALPLEGKEEARPWMERVAAVMGREGRSGLMAAWRAAAETTAALAEWRALIEEEEKAAFEKRMVGVEPTDKEESALDDRISARYKEGRTLLLRALVWWQRDLLAAVCGSENGLLIYTEHAARIREQAKGLSPAAALARIEAVEEMGALMEQNVSENVAWESGFARLMGETGAG